MPDARLRLKQLYGGRADPQEWRNAQGDLFDAARAPDPQRHAPVDASERPTDRVAARDLPRNVDAFSSASLKNSTCSLDDVRRWKQQFPAVSTLPSALS